MAFAHHHEKKTVAIFDAKEWVAQCDLADAKISPSRQIQDQFNVLESYLAICSIWENALTHQFAWLQELKLELEQREKGNQYDFVKFSTTVKKWEQALTKRKLVLAQMKSEWKSQAQQRCDNAIESQLNENRELILNWLQQFPEKPRIALADLSMRGLYTYLFDSKYVPMFVDMSCVHTMQKPKKAQKTFMRFFSLENQMNYHQADKLKRAQNHELETLVNSVQSDRCPLEEQQHIEQKFELSIGVVDQDKSMQKRINHGHAWRIHKPTWTNFVRTATILPKCSTHSNAEKIEKLMVEAAVADYAFAGSLGRDTDL